MPSSQLSLSLSESKSNKFDNDNDNDNDYEHEHEIIIRHACEGRHPGLWHKAMLAYRLN
jgi:hypothetical protein